MYGIPAKGMIMHVCNLYEVRRTKRRQAKEREERKKERMREREIEKGKAKEKKEILHVHEGVKKNACECGGCQSVTKDPGRVTLEKGRGGKICSAILTSTLVGWLSGSLGIWLTTLL